MKQQLIEDYLNQPLNVGDSIYVQGLGSQDKSSWFSTTKVIRIEGDDISYFMEGGEHLLVSPDTYSNIVTYSIIPN